MSNPSDHIQKAFTEYVETLASQRFDDALLDYTKFEQHKHMLEAMSAVQESSVSVFDLRKMEHTFLSRNFEAVLGYKIDEALEEGSSYFDKRVHPEDFYHATLSGAHFLKLAIALPVQEKKDFKLIHEYRIQNARGKYVRVIEQFKALEICPLGNIWLSLSVLDLSPDQDPSATFRNRLVNIRTGELFEPPTFAPPPSSNDALSDREREVLQLIAKGHISKQIADKLYISVHTVNTHRQRIIEKLNVTNTAEAVNYAFSLGMLV